MRFSALIFVLIVAISCGTTRHSVSQERTTESATAVSQRDSSSTYTQVNQLLQEAIESDVNLQTTDEIEIIQEQFSAPDSSGKSHLEVRTITRYKGTTKSVQSSTYYDSHSTQEQTIIDSVSTMQEQTTTNDEMTIQESGSRKSNVGIVSAAVIAVVILILSILIKRMI